MTILVTGAAGFIGHNLCLSLLAQGKQVVGVDNLNDYDASDNWLLVCKKASVASGPES